MLQSLSNEELVAIDGGVDLKKFGAWCHRTWNAWKQYWEDLADEYVEEYGGVFQNCD